LKLDVSNIAAARAQARPSKEFSCRGRDGQKICRNNTSWNAGTFLRHAENLMEISMEKSGNASIPALKVVTSKPPVVTRNTLYRELSFHRARPGTESAPPFA
jgi:hypothetical protein